MADVNKKMDVDSFYEMTSEALEEISDEDGGEERTAAEWLVLLGRKLNASVRHADDAEDEDVEDADDGDGED